MLENAGVTCAPIYGTAQAYEDPQVRHRRMLREVQHPLAGAMKIVANPINYSATPLDRYEAPPLLGQHTQQVLRDVLGVDVREFERLREAGVV